MTNPDNAIGTNGAYSGRTSVNAFNDCISSYSRGILSGWSCVVSSGLTVSLGGVNGTRDVAVATDNNGNNTTIDNISESPVNVTISSAPATNARIDSIVAYVDNPPTGVSTTADNPNACGLIVVKGTVANSPIEPDDGMIRTAITADGGSGTTAYYVVLANVTIASGTTDLDASNIAQGEPAQMNGGLIENGSIAGEKIDWSDVADGITPIGNFKKSKWTTIWDDFYGAGYATTAYSGTYTTLAGSQIGYIVINAATGGQITNGGGSLDVARGGFTFHADIDTLTPDVAVRGIRPNTSASVFVTGGIDNGSAVTPNHFSAATATTSANYTGAIKLGVNQASAYTCEYTVTRSLQNNPWWFINGTIMAGWHVASISFTIAVRAENNDVIPGLYRPGAGTSAVWNTLKAASWFEVKERLA